MIWDIPIADNFFYRSENTAEFAIDAPAFAGSAFRLLASTHLFLIEEA